MGKLLSWIILIGLVWAAIKLLQISQRKREAARRAAADAFGDGAGTDEAGSGAGNGTGSGVARKPFGESMVQCAHCGVFMPRSAALPHGDRFYCDSEHQRLDSNRGT
ncbi:MAG: hypothetical protein J0H09_29210 [Burkholderiales bacterium]|nr:hypothetical protein [Burkholderiales bacterium]ODU63089.1 MAG: hypothetical protein ABT05_06145 [Lautropia sp. SCN 66-9]